MTETHQRDDESPDRTFGVLSEEDGTQWQIMEPGVGPARKRALLKHFGSPDAILSASRQRG